jgi:hypothetical protein
MYILIKFIIFISHAKQNLPLQRGRVIRMPFFVKNGLAERRFHRHLHPREKQIDEMVYKLYGLTDDEIKIVERKG